MLILAIALMAVGVSSVAWSQTPSKPTLEERLLAGLQARRPSEISFVEAVVDTVHRGKLPEKLVDRTYFWARSRSVRQGGRKARRPIVYFQPALTIQAEKLGIRIKKN